MRHLHLEPCGDEHQKIKKLCISLAPLLVELTRLRVDAGVFQCVTTLVTDPTSLLGNPLPDDALEPFAVGTQPTVEDPLAHWDAVVQDLDEPPVPTTPAQPPPTWSSWRTCSAGPLVEDQILYLPSNGNVTPRNNDIELALRKEQAKAQLHQLWELISKKSFLYSDVICKAPWKGVRTHARGTIKGINSQISLCCQVYSHCQSRLIDLGANDETMTQFRELKKEDIRASTAILTPNTPRSTSLQLLWIWHDVTWHILSAVDAKLPTTDAATSLECMSSSCSSHYSF